jgi:hypothetical protein
MSDAQYEFENNEKLVWKKAKSHQGHFFHYAGESTRAFCNKELGKLHSDPEHKEFSVHVDWPIKKESEEWINVSAEIGDKTGITRYRLLSSPGMLYNYTLEFYCTLHYDYFFVDQSGDKYQCDVWAKGKHYINYNSSDPAITTISGY